MTSASGTQIFFRILQGVRGKSYFFYFFEMRKVKHIQIRGVAFYFVYPDSSIQFLQQSGRVHGVHFGGNMWDWVPVFVTKAESEENKESVSETSAEICVRFRRMKNEISIAEWKIKSLRLDLDEHLAELRENENAIGVHKIKRNT